MHDRSHAHLPQTKPLLLGTVYRAPDSKAEYIDKLDLVFQNCTSLYDDVVIVGDFNLDLCKTSNNTKVNKLASHCNMKQLISDYTRITETTKTILDLAFVTNPNRISDSGVHSCGLSDHSLIYLVRKNKKVKIPSKTIKYRSMRNFCDNEFVSSVKNENWDIVLNYDDVNDALDVWKQLFNNVCDTHAPIKERLVKGSSLPEWINRDFIQLTKDRDYYFKRAHKTNHPDDWKNAKLLRNKANNMNKYLKKTYCNNAINENVNNSKKLWSTIKKLIPDKKSSVHAVKSGKKITTNDKETADKFNDFFSSIGNNLAKNFDDNDDVENNVTSNYIAAKFCFDYITPEFVFDEICKMNNNKSPGISNFDVRLLKLAAPVICKPLAYICNLSLHTSCFPNDWKLGKVTPIHKEGDKYDVNNYRPISVLPVLSKIIERAVHDQLYSFLTDNNILNSCQSGFRRNHSTSSSLIDVSDYILQNMNQGLVTGALFLDLKKAFDTVNYDILLKKLHNYGVTGNSLNWFRSYLSGRMQAVNINSTLSDFKHVNIGIPQGSILGPLLFIIYVNSLPDCINCKCVMYADDTTLLFKSADSTSLQFHMNDCMSKIVHWFKINKLTLNIKKTKYMIFGTNNALRNFDDISLNYGNDIIERVYKFKYLGVIFDPTLAWNEHVDYISSVVSKRIGVIRRVKFYLPPATLSLLANSLVFPHFDYCSPVWTNCISEISNSLQILQNKLARVLLSADIRTPISDMMSILCWDKLHERWNKQLLVIVFKCLHHNAPSYLSSQFVFTSSIHSKCTRSQSCNTLVLPFWNNNQGKRTFYYRGASMWNRLSPEIRSKLTSMSLNMFKYSIK